MKPSSLYVYFIQDFVKIQSGCLSSTNNNLNRLRTYIFKSPWQIEKQQSAPAAISQKTHQQKKFR